MTVAHMSWRLKRLAVMHRTCDLRITSGRRTGDEICAKVELHESMPFWPKPYRAWQNHPQFTHAILNDDTHGEVFRRLEDLGYQVHHWSCFDPLGGFTYGTVYLTEEAIVALRMII